MIFLSGSRRLPLIVTLVVLALTLGVLSTAAESFGYLLLGGALGVVSVGLIVGIWNIAGLATALILGCALFVSMIALRAGSELTVADAFLAGAMFPVVVLAVRRSSSASPKPDLTRWHLPVIGLIALVVAGGLGGSFLANDQTLSLSELGRFAASSALVVLLFWLWSPDRRTLEKVCMVLVLGASVNALLGLFLEKFGDRAMGLSGHPNHLALACTLALGTTLGLLTSTSTNVRRAALTVPLALLSVGVIVSGSRAGLVGSFVTVATFMVLTRRWKLVAIGSVAAGLVAVAIYFNLFAIGELNAVNRMLGDRSAFEADRERAAFAQATVEAILDNPIIGSGFESAKSAHSIYLQLWASAGALGVLFAVGLGVMTLRILILATRRSDLVALGMASSYAGYLVLGSVSNILWDRYLWIHLAVLLSLIATPARSSYSPEPPADDPRMALNRSTNRRPTSSIPNSASA